MDADGDQLQASRTFHSKDMWRRIWICLLSSSSLYLHLLLYLYLYLSLFFEELESSQASLDPTFHGQDMWRRIWMEAEDTFCLSANVTLKSALLTLRTKVYWLCWLFIKSAFWKSSKEQWSHLSGTFKHCVSNSC